MLKRLQVFIAAVAAACALQAQVTEHYEKVEGQVLVQLKQETTPQAFMVHFATQSRSGGGIWLEKKLSAHANVHLLKFDTLSVSPDVLLDELRSDPNVAAAHFDFRVHPRNDPDDPGFGDQWGLDQIGARLAWEISTGGVTAGGDTIVVAILDTGFDLEHEDLRGNIWVNREEVPGDGVDNDQNGYIDDRYGWNFIDDSPEHVPDVHGHSVAGIIGARGNNGRGITGLNWNVKLMLLETRMVSEIISAYEYILDQRERYNHTHGSRGAFVVATNASFGINRLHCSDQPIWGEMYDRLGQAGILSAAGAANNAWDVDEVGDMPTTCASDFLLTVLNTDYLDQRYPGSAYGARSIDLGAPGQRSYTTRPFDQYGEFNGNSAAAPHLTGAIALLYSAPCRALAEKALADPALAALEVRQALLDGVDPIPALEGQTVTGGRLNIHNSMLRITQTCPEAAPPDLQLAVFPNPAVSELYLRSELPEGAAGAALEVFNAVGKRQVLLDLTQQPAGPFQTRLDLKGWPQGLYFIRFRTDAAQELRRVVVVR